MQQADYQCHWPTPWMQESVSMHRSPTPLRHSRMNQARSEEENIVKETGKTEARKLIEKKATKLIRVLISTNASPKPYINIQRHYYLKNCSSRLLVGLVIKLWMMHNKRHRHYGKTAFLVLGKQVFGSFRKWSKKKSSHYYRACNFTLDDVPQGWIRLKRKANPNKMIYNR